MLLINMFFLCLLTLCGILYTYQYRLQLTCTDGMIIAMVIGGLSGISLGMNIQIYLVNDLTNSTIIAIIIGMIAGYSTGKPVSLMASIDGVMAGFMGGMMSPMLGAMLNNPIPMIWFLDLVYILVSIMLFSLVKEAKEYFLKQISNEEQENINS
jgi:hypothetical protein